MKKIIIYNSQNNEIYGEYYNDFVAMNNYHTFINRYGKENVKVKRGN